MTTFASQITSPMATAISDLAGAVTNFGTVQTNMNATNFGTITLGNLATSTLSWRSDIGSLRTDLDAALANLSFASQALVRINNLLISIGSND